MNTTMQLIIGKTLMITVFVSAMMLIIEYLNVQTSGKFLTSLSSSKWRQYLSAALLGALPGCLGAFVVVTLYSHKKVSIGAVTAAMIATSGDETFVMLSLFPATTIALTAGLAVVGAVSGWLTDLLLPLSLTQMHPLKCDGLKIHDPPRCRCFSIKQVISQLKQLTPYRGTLMTALALVIIATIFGHIGPAVWGWKRITLLLVMTTALFVVSTVPDTFLEKHLWRHVAMRHVPRIFLWTGGTIVLLTIVMQFVDVRSLIAENPVSTLLVAAGVGIIPESGPHLVFVNLYDEQLLPLSVLVASSIVQDGHGMLPMLSASKRGFVLVKLINLLVGVMVGMTLLLIGF